MKCYVHVTQQRMLSVFEIRSDHPFLYKVSSDLKFWKRIVEYSKCFGWNKDLMSGHMLMQNVETRFGTVYLVCNQSMEHSFAAQS